VEVLAGVGAIQTHGGARAVDAFVTDVAEEGAVGVLAHGGAEVEAEADVRELGRGGGEGVDGEAA
jgi:hypothetical protein